MTAPATEFDVAHMTFRITGQESPTFRLVATPADSRLSPVVLFTGFVPAAMPAELGALADHLGQLLTTATEKGGL